MIFLKDSQGNLHFKWKLTISLRIKKYKQI